MTNPSYIVNHNGNAQAPSAPRMQNKDRTRTYTYIENLLPKWNEAEYHAKTRDTKCKHCERVKKTMQNCTLLFLLVCVFECAHARVL